MLSEFIKSGNFISQNKNKMVKIFCYLKKGFTRLALLQNKEKTRQKGNLKHKITMWCCSTMPNVNSCKTIEKLYEIGNSKIIQTTLYSYFRIVHSTNFSLVYNVSWSFFSSILHIQLNYHVLPVSPFKNLIFKV